MPSAPIIVAGVYGSRHDGIPTGAEFDAVMHANVLGAMVARAAPPTALSSMTTARRFPGKPHHRHETA